jgi:hypothetical protein
MAKVSAFFAVVLSASLAATAANAAGTKGSVPRQAAKGFFVTDHVPQLDGPTTIVTAPDGRRWAAWSYRASGEFDIAVSSVDADGTMWSAPVFFGKRSGSDEIDPVIAVDSRGAVYVAFTTADPARVVITMLAPGAIAWSDSFVVSETEAASSPAIALVGDQPVVAFRTPRGVRISIPTFGVGSTLDGIADGPDPVGSGIKGNGLNPPGGPTSDRNWTGNP